MVLVLVTCLSDMRDVLGACSAGTDEEAAA